MAHHKRRRHPRARAGCSLCKPWKKFGIPTDNGGESVSNHRRRHGIWDDAQQDLKDERHVD